MMPNHEKKVIIMWIHVHSKWNANFNSKIGNKRRFSYETKASIRNEMRFLCESMFISIERRTSILKLVIREAFLMKPKHQYH